MSELPSGWTEVGFEEINGFRSATINPADFPDELFELYSVPTYPTKRPEIVRGADIGSTKQGVAAGDVLICKINPRINRVWKVLPKSDKRQIASSEWIVMRATGINPDFLRSFFSSTAFREILCEELTGVGGSLTRAQPKRVARFRIPIAPLAEQKRIADKLEAVLGRVDACRARLDRVPSLLKRFRQSVLAAATSGRLTEEWRGSQSRVPSDWSERPLGQLCEKGRIITYGVIKLGDEITNGIPCLRTSNVRWLNIDTVGMKRIAERISSEYGRTILKGGEVLVNVRGTLGGVAVAENNMAGWNVSREVAVVPVDQTILFPLYLAYWIGSDATQRWLVGVQKGVAYTGINIEDLRELPVNIPPLPEQREIVRRVKALFAFADRIEARLATGQKTVERLTPSVLAKAFRGELLPRDPDDEPASVLLERLRASRAQAPVARRPRQTGAPKRIRTLKETTAMTKSRFDDDVKGQPYLANLLLKDAKIQSAEALFKLSELSLVDFYKQLAWEVEHGKIRDDKSKLEAVG
jgi:type I restriction enzyme S subunit